VDGVVWSWRVAYVVTPDAIARGRAVGGRSPSTRSAGIRRRDPISVQGTGMYARLRGDPFPRPCDLPERDTRPSS
jgi:hypothetical protein